MLFKILMGLYLGFVVVDSALTGIGIEYYGLVETWQSAVLFEYYGLVIGLIVSTAFCFIVGWLLWRIRGFKVAAYVGLSALVAVEFAAVVNNAGLIMS